MAGIHIEQLRRKVEVFLSGIVPEDSPLCFGHNEGLKIFLRNPAVNDILFSFSAILGESIFFSSLLQEFLLDEIRKISHTGNHVVCQYFPSP